MRKLLLAIAVVFSAGTLMAQMKIGHVNSQAILDTMPSRDKAEKMLSDFEAEGQKELQEMQIDLQTAYKNYEAKVGDMTPVMRQIEEKKIMDKEQRLQKRNQDFQMELQAYANELNGPILKRIQDAVSKVAESKKLNYVIDETVTLYFAGGIDITDEVIAEVMKEEAKLKSADGTN